MDTVQCPSNGVYTNVEESKANRKSKWSQYGEKDVPLIEIKARVPECKSSLA